MDTKENFRILFESMLGGVAISCLFFWLFSKYGIGLADEGLLWYASQRTYAGELAIRDFFSYDPGRYYWNGFIFWLTKSPDFNSLLAAAAAFGMLGLVVSWFTLAKANIAKGWRLLFGLAIALALFYPRHKVYEQTLSLLLVCVTYFVLTRPLSAKRWFVFGVMTGAAAFFGRNHGIFFLVTASLAAGYLLIGRGPRGALPLAMTYCAGIVVGYLPMIYLVVTDAAFRFEFIQSIISIADWQLPLPIPFFWRGDYSSGITLDTLLLLSVGLFCVLLPLIYGFGIARLYGSARHPERMTSDRLLLGAASIAGFPYLHQAFDRADFGHIAQSSLPFFIALAAMTSMAGSVSSVRGRIASVTTCLIILAVTLSAWMISLPMSTLFRAEARYPGATASHTIDGQEHVIFSSQAQILREMTRVVKACQASDNEILALPHFPGIYAYLGVRAPFWEMYYLYPRSQAFQQRHIEAVSGVKVVLIAPDATVDGLERLKLKHTYGDLLRYVENRFTKLSSSTLPEGTFIYIDRDACPGSLDRQ